MILAQMLTPAPASQVTLLGQNVDAYGRDLPGMAPDGSGRRLHTFTDLLQAVHEVEGIERIRFATSHPRYFTERLVRACSQLPKLCEFFHIPFQAGDDDVLREMLRGYTGDRYREIIHNIRRCVPPGVSATLVPPLQKCTVLIRTRCCAGSRATATARSSITSGGARFRESLPLALPLQARCQRSRGLSVCPVR